MAGMTTSLGRLMFVAILASVQVGTAAAAERRPEQNALQRRADLLEPDRWRRSEAASGRLAEIKPSEPAPTFGATEPAPKSEEKREELSPDDPHRGELNGNLRLGNW